MGTTTIALSKETKEMLRHFGEKGESYDRIVRKLIKEASWEELDKRWNKILAEDEFIPLDEL
ncbi:MAG: hypothetical protein KAI64_04565 [Thermoplasmata archaeon]|nr:hypothetical protein [Thermoplasmata archaeon]